MTVWWERALGNLARLYLSNEGVAAIDFVVESRQEGPWTVVDVQGEVDMFTAPKLRERLRGKDVYWHREQTKAQRPSSFV